MKRIDFACLIFIITAVFIIFYPIFYSEYLYTDEAVQLWLSDKGLNFGTSVPQGRYITYKLFEWLFKSINTVHGVIYPRLFSLFGWILCLPVWYFIINKVVIKNGLPKSLAFLSLIYVISMPPFALYVGWAACLELFIACTSGLIAGYALHTGIRYDGKTVHVSTSAIALSIIFGIISLFTYQNGFGCFFIPFFIHFISTKKITKNTYIGIGISLLIHVAYFLLFRYTLRINAMEASYRSSLSSNPIAKLLFLFTQPLAGAFHFTFLFNEKSIVGFAVYFLLASGWLIINLTRQKSKPWSEKLSYLSGLIIFFIVIYLPSLVVKENYASGRTLFALNLAIFFLIAETVFHLIKKHKTRYMVTSLISILFLVNAWYNYHKQFFEPLTAEYNLLRDIIARDYKPGINIIYFIRPEENTFEKKYGIVRSWDEFGVASTAKPWVPEPLIKQLIFEKTGDHQIAEKVIVKSWIDNEAFQKSGETVSKGTLLIDLKEMILKQ